ncbi:MAG: molybdopterin molybdenumtransferase MoeA [Balneolaceae bacterium]|nr:MAG: molybdopterin molybdenumtransferase MoeA [Balneolaceae bacterium]
METGDTAVNVSVNQALEFILNRCFINPGSEDLNAAETLNRVLSSDIRATRDVPRFDNSAMDGFLFLTEDLTHGRKTFHVAGEIRPEYRQPAPIEPGTSSRIMTGAPVPNGNYSVVPVELVKEQNGSVTVLQIPARNPIRQKGEGYRKGGTVLEKGALIRPYEMGLIIESGNKTCRVLKKLRLAIQVTGTEIDENMDSNGPVLEALAASWPGVDAKRWPVLKDNPDAVTQRMEELRESADIVITTGGISAGRYDYLPESMKSLGADVIVRKVRQKPGGPFTVTRLGGIPFFHLPGNPVSAVFTAEYYTRRLIRHLTGMKSGVGQAFITNRIENNRSAKTLFLTGNLGFDSEKRLTVTTESNMHSHLMQLYKGNHAYVRIEPETVVQPGDVVEITPFSNTGILFSD